MRDRPTFIETSREFEPVNQVNTMLADENARLDNERLKNPGAYMNKIVYDCVDQSPFYSADENYLDENELLELPSEDANYDYRKYPFGPTVPNNAFS